MASLPYRLQHAFQQHVGATPCRAASRSSAFGARGQPGSNPWRHAMQRKAAPPAQHAVCPPAGCTPSGMSSCFIAPLLSTKSPPQSAAHACVPWHDGRQKGGLNEASPPTPIKSRQYPQPLCEGHGEGHRPLNLSFAEASPATKAAIALLAASTLESNSRCGACSIMGWSGSSPNTMTVAAAGPRHQAPASL